MLLPLRLWLAQVCETGLNLAPMLWLSGTLSVVSVQPAQYIEEGPNASLKVQDLGESPQVRTFTGPATGKKVTATWYDYAVSPAFSALIKSGPGPYVDVGNCEVGDVTTLRLDTDTQAIASFATPFP